MHKTSILELSNHVFKTNAVCFPVHSVHRLCRRDGSPLSLVLAVLSRTKKAKNIFNNLNRVCGLSGIRVETPHKKGGPGQCHLCQLYDQAAANCHALREMFGPTLDQRVLAYSSVRRETLLRELSPAEYGQL
ncbi:hypothetical protein EVAR_50139_1 [Eumeta japonica]|uniref:Pre-C2HC domain-containing protein n=1 Tax=Eumeta variegata TaxID=151549 RepID=A0A4C1YV94_EUMVA|nr:hypothetical protein EVAR_50139_1 [Eumeta japonica]